jgi:hypothetical protein
MNDTRKIMSRSTFNQIQPEGSIRKEFDMTGAFGVDAYARKPVMKQDAEGRHYRDFEGYLYSEDDLLDIMDAYNDPNEGFQNMVKSMMERGKQAKEAIAMARFMGQVPYVNHEYVADDMKDYARGARDAAQEGRPLAFAGNAAMGLLTGADAAATYAPFALGPAYRGAKGLIKEFIRDRADVATPPRGGFLRKEPPLRSRGLLEQ